MRLLEMLGLGGPACALFHRAYHAKVYETMKPTEDGEGDFDFEDKLEVWTCRHCDRRWEVVKRCRV